MYSAQSPTARTVFKANAPILAICALFFVFFLIAGTIVLALIPIYLSTKDVAAVGRSSTYYATMTPDVSLPEGTLDAQSLKNINNELDKALKVHSGAVNMISGIVSGGDKKRRRRGLLLDRNRRGAVRVYCSFYFNIKICPRCGNAGFRQTIRKFTFTVQLWIIDWFGILRGPFYVTFTVVISYTPIAIPSTSTFPMTTVRPTGVFFG
ncbi:unnamed protein product [Adineta ricciae]|uniref:Uncharacterized protein n=1 Tax=Adineta ricciae TaxID=249248 RepID=A0A815C3F1_ADIRI|nr:unnamed protein product [Adineta ricciae]